MNRENLKKEKKRLFFYCGGYSFICEVISLFLLGFDAKFLIGLCAGTICVILNYILLEFVVDIAIISKKTSVAFLLQLGRLFIFGLTGYACFAISYNSLIAYAIGVLGIVGAAVLTYRKEGNNGKLR